MSAYENYANNAAAIIQRGGANRANAQRESGQIWGQTIGNLGQIAGHAIEQIPEIQKQQKAEQKQKQLASIFQKHGQDLDGAIQEIYTIDPTLAMDLGKRKHEADTAAFHYKTSQFDAKQKELDFTANLIGAAKDQDSYTQALYTAKAAGIDVSQIPPEYNPQVVEGFNRAVMTAKERMEADRPQAPKEPKLISTTPGMKVIDEAGKVVFENPYQMTPDQSADNAARDAAAKEAERHNKAVEGRPAAAGGGRPVAVLGPDGKTPIYVPADQAVGKTPAPSTTARETSEDERKSAGFYRQMNSAIKTMDEVESKLTEKELYQIANLPQEGLIGMANRGQLSENAKRYLRAFEQFTEARLRPVSGAAISDSEYARDRRTYARQFSETPKLSEDRTAARRQALGTLKTRAGRAFTEEEGDDEGGGWVDVGGGVQVRKK